MQLEKHLIKHLSKDDQPREKLLINGPSSMSNSELLAIIIGSGTRNRSAVDLSKDLLMLSQNSITQLAKKNVKELTRVKGIGTVKALGLCAAFELGKRRKREFNSSTKICSSQDAYVYSASSVEDLSIEEFWVIVLSRSNKVLAKKRISSGGVTSTVVDIKCIVKFCLEHLASAVVVFHNHPSGNRAPSQADKNITQKLIKALGIFDINLLDHLIITASDYYSFSDEGEL